MAFFAEVKTAVKEKSIIVLTFENISPDPDNEYFSDGLTEEIITDLSRIHDLLVISRSSAMTFKGTNKTILEIAQSVNVHYVLEGSVRKSGNNLRITAQLIDSDTDVHLWAEKYSGTLMISTHIFVCRITAISLQPYPANKTMIEPCIGALAANFKIKSFLLRLKK